MGRPSPRPLVWLCAPYTGSTSDVDGIIGNPLFSAASGAVELAANVWRGGELDFIIPQVMVLATLIKPMTVEEWERWRFDFIGHCDALLVVGEGGNSYSRQEIKWAQEQEVPVFESIIELIWWWRTRSKNS